MKRIIFAKGKQKEFLETIKTKLNISSLRLIKQFGIETNYSTLKNYYQEKRLMPEQLFKELCQLARINIDELKISYAEDNLGQINGGKKGIITLRKKYSKKLGEWRRKGGMAKKKTYIQT